ncbi:hypothetical protein GCM10009584_10140 [Ornithinimicrobium humiphilum]|uniref:Heavy metal transporter n=1 Tax=Ornithinimicrobium humiphilum TaxID=125288 RepID=A0A543KR19_9MICO|nr:hypothetical protein [Ornithinimicrobium humiphilum]TQM97523.1 hypothetical protein FB476_2436 [Ornithinimicrobium humiphilum]
MRRSRAGRTLTALALVGATAVAGVLGARWVADRLASPTCVFSAAGEEVTLTPEQAANAATIAGVAVQRGLPSRAATIALATAIQESKLRNLPYGDADSQGLFQQRPSQGWGSVEEIRDPVYASHAFYDVLVEVEGWEDGVVTEVAQEVQRSAFPDAYADHETEGRVLASVLTGQEGTGTALGCRLDPARGDGDPAAIADKAARQLGVTGTPGEGTVTFELGDAATAWTVATWAVSHAASEDVTLVRVDGREWRRDHDPLRLVESPEPVGATTVVVATG